MNKDIRAAMLGDHEAAKRLTEAGVLIPCPGCGIHQISVCHVCGDCFIQCDICEWAGPIKGAEAEARLAWNTRAPILSSKEMEMLEGME